MRREVYQRTLSNHQIELLIDRLDQAVEFFQGLAQFAELSATAGRETLTTRRSVAQGRMALDFGEVLEKVKTQNDRLYQLMKEAKVLRFDLGRLHLRFETDDAKAQFALHRWNLESICSDLYGVTFKIHCKQSAER